MENQLQAKFRQNQIVNNENGSVQTDSGRMEKRQTNLHHISVHKKMDRKNIMVVFIQRINTASMGLNSSGVCRHMIVQHKVTGN